MFTHKYSTCLLHIVTLNFLALLPSMEQTINTMMDAMSVHVLHRLIASHI